MPLNPRLLWQLLLIGGVAVVGNQSTLAQSPTEPPRTPTTLDALRDKVAANERSTSLFKLNYTVRFDRPQSAKSGEGDVKLSRSGNLRAPQKFYSHQTGVWAQDGALQHSNVESYFEGSDRPERGGLNVFNGEVVKTLSKANPKQGGISDIKQFQWNNTIHPSTLGVRPFEGENELSKVLVPELAKVRPQTEVVNGRPTYVVDVQRPAEPSYYARMWLDAEEGLPLKIHYYQNSPDDPQAKPMQTVEGIQLHRLPGGGVLPVGGDRTVIGPEGPIATQHIKVDVDSITTRREDIPATLFDLKFPEGTSVHNAILGVSEAQNDLRLSQTVETAAKLPPVQAPATLPALAAAQAAPAVSAGTSAPPPARAPLQDGRRGSWWSGTVAIGLVSVAVAFAAAAVAVFLIQRMRGTHAKA